MKNCLMNYFQQQDKKLKLEKPLLNMFTDINLSKARISKIIWCGGSFSSRLGNLGQKALTSIVVPFARDNLSQLVSNVTSSAIK